MLYLSERLNSLKCMAESTKVTIVNHINDDDILETINQIGNQSDILSRQVSEYAEYYGMSKRLARILFLK